MSLLVACRKHTTRTPFTRLYPPRISLPYQDVRIALESSGVTGHCSRKRAAYSAIVRGSRGAATLSRRKKRLELLLRRTFCNSDLRSSQAQQTTAAEAQAHANRSRNTAGRSLCFPPCSAPASLAANASPDRENGLRTTQRPCTTPLDAVVAWRTWALRPPRLRTPDPDPPHRRRSLWYSHLRTTNARSRNETSPRGGTSSRGVIRSRRSNKVRERFRVTVAAGYALCCPAERIYLRSRACGRRPWDHSVTAWKELSSSCYLSFLQDTSLPTSANTKLQHTKVSSACRCRIASDMRTSPSACSTMRARATYTATCQSWWRNAVYT